MLWLYNLCVIGAYVDRLGGCSRFRGAAVRSAAVVLAQADRARRGVRRRSRPDADLDGCRRGHRTQWTALVRPGLRLHDRAGRDDPRAERGVGHPGVSAQRRCAQPEPAALGRRRKHRGRRARSGRVAPARADPRPPTAALRRDRPVRAAVRGGHRRRPAPAPVVRHRTAGQPVAGLRHPDRGTGGRVRRPGRPYWSAGCGCPGRSPPPSPPRRPHSPSLRCATRRNAPSIG